ncbi:MAG TPA: sugar ABC transporter ATP-binding protein [Burkholderiaceae bacterium]|jgi:simple sugar transport system ATP-binding protein|nr:sugar ABC transporter ATP-binding protein [Burkholderiaceae bacterium]
MSSDPSAASSVAPLPARTADVFLATENIHKRFAGVHALRGVSIAIERGQIYHLLGENGCGKSTLIKIISGAQPPDSGRLLLDGGSFEALTPIQALAAGVETVYQDLSLIPNLTVADNVALSAQLVRHRGRLARRLDRAELNDTARKALAAVNLPVADEFLATIVSELSLAERQLVAIARAVATRAQLVIMDEPTTSLTRREVDQLIRVVEGLRRDNVAVLFVTHKLDECYAIGGQVLVFRDGECVAQGAIREFTKAEIGRLMTGRQIAEARYRTDAPLGPVMLEVEGLGRGTRFTDVAFQLRAGEIIGVTGLMDSGRNELALALAGVVPAGRGRMALAGEAITLESPADAVAQRIGYVPEERLAEGLFLDKPIRANIVVAVLGRLRTALGLIDTARVRKLSEDIVDQLQVATPSIDIPVQALSGGNQQRVLIGRWLTITPRVLVLHGPTVGVDVGSKDTIYRAIQALSIEGLAVLIVSDDLPELLQNCDRILVMRRGRVRAELEAATSTEQTLYQAMLAEDEEIAA